MSDKLGQPEIIKGYSAQKYFKAIEKIEQLEKENTNKDLLLKQKTERINELEKENKSLKDTNFMVENFHKMGERVEELEKENNILRTALSLACCEIQGCDREQFIEGAREFLKEQEK